MEQSTAGRSRLAIYEAIRQTALAQRAALDREDLDAFHELMIEREDLIRRAEETGRNPIEPSERAAATALIREILALDEVNQALLATQIDAAQRELGLIRTGQQVLHSYASLGPGREARFVDRRT